VGKHVDFRAVWAAWSEMRRSFRSTNEARTASSCLAEKWKGEPRVNGPHRVFVPSFCEALVLESFAEMFEVLQAPLLKRGRMSSAETLVNGGFQEQRASYDIQN
jgi:hypothetical protein